MFAVLFVDGTPTDTADDTPESVTLEFDATDGPTHRCRNCSEELTDTGEGYQTTDGDTECTSFESTDDTDPDDGQGPHNPERIPLSWCTSAAIHADESEDSVTVSLSVGDPRGAFTFTIRRVPDDATSDLAGHLIMHTPYPSQPSPHLDLTPLHDGTYVVGPYPAAHRLQSVPAA